MRKLGLFLVLVMAVTILQAQNAKVQSAFNYLKTGKIEKAKLAIDPAIEHVKTMSKAKTWFYYANVYLSIHLAEDSAVKNLDLGALDKAYNAYLKAKELDLKEDFTKDITSRLMIVGEQMFNNGVEAYSNKNYPAAVNYFNKTVEVNENFGRLDTTALFYSTLSAQLGDMDSEATTGYEKLMAMNYRKPVLYTNYSSLVMESGDTLKALDIIQKGRIAYPDDFNVLITETNIYLGTNQVEKALANLEMAVQKDTTNHSIWFAVGANYDQLMQKEEAGELRDTYRENAKSAYQKAIELKPDYFDAYYNMGALNVNDAATLTQAANALPLGDEKYEGLIEKANTLLEEALPYLEKGYELNAKDQGTLYSLKEIYTRLKMYEKLKEVNAQIKNL